MKTPQIKPDWAAGIYIGNGTIALRDGKVTLDKPPVSYAPMFKFGDTETAGNAQRFATRQEAYDSAQDRFRVWTMPTGFYVEESDDPVNYRRENGADVSFRAIDDCLGLLDDTVIPR